MVAAYLNIAAITVALVLACLATGVVIRLFAQTFAIHNCLNTGQSLTYMKYCISVDLNVCTCYIYFDLCSETAIGRRNTNINNKLPGLLKI